MVELSKVDDFKLVKTKLYLPRTEEDAHKGACAILLNKDKESIDIFGNHPMLETRGLYKSVYRNKIIVFKIKSTKVQNKDLKACKDYYRHCYDTFGFISGLMGIHDKNFYYDTYPEQELFFANCENLPRLSVGEEWVKMMKSNVLSFPLLEKYPTKYILLSLEDWMDKEFNPIDIIARLMKKQFELFQSIGDYDMIFLTGEAWFKMNPARCTERSGSEFIRIINRLNKTLIVNDWIIGAGADEVSNPSDRAKAMLNDNDVDTGDDDLDERIKKIADEEKDRLDDEGGMDSEKREDAAANVALNDPEVVHSLALQAMEPVSIKKTSISKRDEMLREKQKDIVVGKTKLSDIYSKKYNETPIPVNDLSNKLNTLNKDICKVHFSNFQDTYNQELYEKDILSIADALQNKSVPVYIREATVEDTSDSMNAKVTYTFKLEDSNRGRHTLKFDVPKFIEGKYMYLNGHKKEFNYQRFLKPLVKTGPDTVQVCTNYNKIFMYRYGEKVEAKYEKFKTLVMTDKKNFSFVKGDCSRLNNEYLTSIEYDTLAKTFAEITVKSSNPLTLIFSQPRLKELASNMGLEKDYKEYIAQGRLVVGFSQQGKRKFLFAIDPDSTIMPLPKEKEEIVKAANEMFSIDALGDPFAYSELE